MRFFYIFILSFLLEKGMAQPQIDLPSGYNWVAGAIQTYTNGPFYTGNASGNTSNCGGTTCGSNDTSLGGAFQCSSIPWSVVGTAGANYIQHQKFANIGTSDNSLAFLAVPCNPGVGGTTAGANWPASTSETRRVTMNHWNNSYPESNISSLPLASRTSGTVWIPTSAILKFLDDGIGNGTGVGGDELRLTMIGGDNNTCSSWQINANTSLSITVSGAFGTISGVNGTKISPFISQTLTNIPNAVVYAYNATNGTNHTCCGSCQFQAVNNSWYFTGGVNTTSFGAGFTQNYDVLSAIVDDGSTFTVDFEGEFSISIDRVGGSSGDARATMGPGMGGKVELEVQYQPWTIQAPAPVTLSKFEVIKMDRTSHLLWTTKSETNNEGFAVERSKDGITWEKIDYIKGNGNTSKTIEYQTIDPNPHNGKNYYRLAQNDFDGSVHYSDIRFANHASSRYDVQLYPNPTSDHVNIANLPDQDVQIDIFDNFGKLMFSLNSSKHSLTKINTSHLQSGLYFAKLSFIDSTEYYKFLKCN